MNEAYSLQTLQKRFNDLKDQSNKIKGNTVLTTLKPFFKSMQDNDFQPVFKIFVQDFSLNDADRMITIQQLKFIFLSLQEHFQKIKSHHSIAVFQFQTHYSLRKSGFSHTYLPQITKKPMFQISHKEITDIIPYEIIFFDSLYKRQDKPSMKTPQKLTQQNLQEQFYCYDFKIYEVLLQNFQGPGMNKLVRLFYQVIDFRWIQALNLFKSEIVNDPKLNQAPFVTPVFQNLKEMQQQINKNQNILKPLFEKRGSLQYPNLQSFTPEIAKKIIEIKNIYEFVCSFCSNIYQQFQNPYIRAICYFFSRKSTPECKFEEICENKKLDVMVKFLFARRFLAPNYFKEYNERFLVETRQDPKLQHLMFLKNKAQVVQTISNYYDNHPSQFQRVALTCGIVLHKVGKGFNKEHLFLEHMVKIYQELLRKFTDNQIHKKYMLKMMSVRSAKQPIWEDLIIKPQFKLNCELRNHDCVFLSMLEKFIYGGDEKWNKLKTKSSISADQMKKHYEVQTKYCPYCNSPNPRCSICLEQIKIFTVKSYLNQQIKRKTEKQQKPYMMLNQPLEDALIWCPSCGHGGHFGHLQPWFKEQKTCPVHGCNCKCRF